MVKRCDSLAQVRRQIDALDRRLLDVLAERAQYVRQVIKFKDRDQIVDPDRIEAIIITVRAQASAKSLDPDIAEEVWRTMIDRFIAMETAIFDSEK